MKRIAVTGLTGVIGKVLSDELNEAHRLIDLYHLSKHKDRKVKNHISIDLTKKRSISKALTEAHPEVVVHMAAITHIDVCEEDKKRGKNGLVWKVNVEGTREVASYCAKNDIPLVFLSTECVFDGKKDFFEEKSKKNPINWYGVTKSEAEEEILRSGARSAIIRSVVAYHKDDNERTIYGKILKNLKQEKEFFSVDDQLFTPTYTYDIVRAINRVIDRDLFGVFHVAPSTSLTPYDFALIVAKKNEFSKKLIKKTSLDLFYGPEKASLRLKNSSLSSEKSRKALGFKARMPSKAL